MAQRTLDSRIIIRNDTITHWESTNPVLMKGEIGVLIDNDPTINRNFKIGDGVSTWSQLPYYSEFKKYPSAPKSTDINYQVGALWYSLIEKKLYMLFSKDAQNSVIYAVWKQIVTADDLAALGGGDMLKSEFANNDKADQGYVNAAIEADKWTDKLKLSIDGDIEGSVEFDGSEGAETGVTATVTLPDVNDNVGTFTKVTVNAKGQVTAAETATADDISGLGTAAKADTGVAEGNVPVLDANGKLNKSVIPASAITDTFVVDSEAEMLALQAEPGDIAVRTDTKQTYILKGNDPSQLEDWVLLETPTDAVTSVNGQTGVVNLTTDNVDEGSSNLYFTEARATANFETNIADTEVSSLKDGADVLLSTDTYILNGGNA